MKPTVFVCNLSDEVLGGYKLLTAMVKRCSLNIPGEENNLIINRLLAEYGFSSNELLIINNLFSSSYATVTLEKMELFKDLTLQRNEGEQDYFEKYLCFVEQEAADYVERVSELSSVFGMELRAEERDWELWKYRALCFVGSVIDQWKYCVNRIFLDHFGFLDQDVPLEAKPYFLGIRLLPRRLRVKVNRLKSKNKVSKNADILINTLFQGFKKGLLPVRSEKVISNLLEHAEDLGTDKGAVSDDINDCLERTVIEVMGNERISQSFNGAMPFSAKSTIESNYMDNGAMGELLRRFSPIGTRISWEFYGYLRTGPSWDQIVEVRGPWVTSEELHELAQPEIVKSLFEEPRSEPSCILEPMKVRIITKPKWNQYLGMKSIQQSWWRRLVSHKSGIFKLTGQTVSSEDIRELQFKSTGSHFVSGDYSKATDCLKMAVTKQLLTFMCSSEDLEMQRMCENALTGGKISYTMGRIVPASRDREVWERIDAMGKKFSSFGNIFSLSCFSERLNKLQLASLQDFDANDFSDQGFGPFGFHVKQRNGQLMGSIISFIVLCLANLGAYRHSLETYYGRVISLDEIGNSHPVLINGDDILFKSDREFYQHWKKVITEFGFMPSPGKNLFHKELCQINSVLYRVTDKQGPFNEDIISEIPYINFGLTTNRKKQDCEIDVGVNRTGLTQEVINGSLIGRVRSMKKIQETLLTGLPRVLKERANRLLFKHSKWIRETFPGVDIFQPGQSGGLGLDSIGIEEQSETKKESGHRRRIQEYLQLKNTTLSAWLLNITQDRTIALLREEEGNSFPSLRLCADDSLLEEDRNCTKNRYWKIICMNQKYMRSHVQPLANKIDVTIENRLPHQRMMRFVKEGDIELWRTDLAIRGVEPDDFAIDVMVKFGLLMTLLFEELVV
jgi:hypothetical protein